MVQLHQLCSSDNWWGYLIERLLQELTSGIFEKDSKLEEKLAYNFYNPAQEKFKMYNWYYLEIIINECSNDLNKRKEAYC